jgi:hypothetical protein
MAQAKDYRDVVATSERVAWKVDDVFADHRPDLARAILPESLALVSGIGCLGDAEKLKLNQIRGNSYAYLFNFFEEAIIRAVMGQVAETRAGQDMRLRALLRFAEEEVKHQQLFRRYNDLFKASFGTALRALASRVTAEDVAAAVAKNPPATVFITLLHLELVSQRHYVEAVKNAEVPLDPLFVDVLRSHWVEESQHVKVDHLLLDEFTQQMSPAEAEAAVDGYLELGKAIDNLLYQQVELDVDTLAEAVGRTFSAAERDEIVANQAAACRRCMLWMGMTNKPFVDYLTKLSPPGAAKVAAAAAAMA